MVINDNDIFGPALRKLERLGDLDDADRAAIRALPFRVEQVPAGFTLVRDGETMTHCALLLDAFACRHRETADGARQIVSFHIPGDLLDLASLQLARADHNVQTITPGSVALIPTAEIRALAEARPKVAAVLWRDVLVDASVAREWVVNVGRRNARARIAHMLCEFAARAALGVEPPERIRLPMTQADIADATGLTPIHVNRTLRELDGCGVIVRDKRDVRITDWAGLQRIGGFDPTYLHAAA